MEQKRLKKERSLKVAEMADLEAEQQDLTIQENWPVGQDEIVTQTMELYPNPAKDLVNLKFNEAVDFKVEISDLLGKVVVNQSFTSKNRISMDVSSLPEGLYMIRVVTDNKTYLDRLIVK